MPEENSGILVFSMNNLRIPVFFIIDGISLSLSLLLALWLKFGHLGVLPQKFLTHGLPLIIPVSIVVFHVLGLYKRNPRFASIDDLVAIFSAVSCSSFLKLVICKVVINGPEIPSIFVLDWMLSLLLIGISRAFPRILLNLAELDRVRRWLFGRSNEPIRRVLIIGAGQAGESIAREIKRNLNLPYQVAGFVDDDQSKIGQIIHGFKILGICSNVAQIAEEYSIDEVIIAIPSAKGNQLRRIFDLCQNARLRFKTLPALDDLDRSRLFGLQLREIAIEDLLRRAPTRINVEEISACIEGKTVMVTGAGGSIGGEICLQMLQFKPSIILLLGRGENSLYDSMQRLLQHPDYDKTLLLPLIADIRDEERIRQIFHAHRPELVFHAAGHKQVPLMEKNPEEAIKCNVVGTRILVQAAHETGCERFINVSTDQAVNPTSVIGASKNVAEQILQIQSKISATRFVSLRFGNVLGSRGSVLPLFREQIAKGGPVTVTHPKMVRYFLTVPEAARLVLQSATFGKGGEIFIFDMGEPVRIVDLAEDLIRLSGFQPGKDIEIKFTGIREGEKLFEELLTSHEGVLATRNSKIFIYPAADPEANRFSENLNQLEQAARSKDHNAIMQTLRDMVETFSPDRDRVYNENPAPPVRQPKLRVV
ncbi:MAG: nucleoside-diphosphate sugar epimerase/dehydratase [Candidatus Riflebacteria bacterium]